MKKLGIIAMAMALLLTMSQCKKENTTTPTNEGSKVPITLNVSSGNGSRVAVNTENGEVTFENGDALYVASNGVYIGLLTYNGTNFSGNVTEPTEGQKLHFYFLGNVDTEETLIEGTTTGCSVVISNQTEHLPVISYAPSRENYQVGKTDYNATLLNKCALVKFDVTTLAATATCIKGMNNKVEMDFATNSFDYTQEEDGVICMAAGSGERWTILLPQDAMEEGDEGSVYSYGGSYSGVRPEIPAIAENEYLTDGIAIEINTPVGFVNGLFSVSATQQVYFSQGNLQYQASTNTWQFAEHQYDYVGSANSSISQTNSGWIDLFGWGTSGYDHGANAYQPWSTSQTYSDYYAYGAYTNNLYDGNGQADWGYNAISNGSNTENSGWRTLTKDEWEYVFNTRTTTSGIHYAKGNVNGVNGIILLPDNWTVTTYALNNTNISGANFTSNTITATDWTNVLEANGAVFLPAAGYRYGTSVINVGSHGYYWSASYSGFRNDAFRVYFTSTNLNIINGYYRYWGQSVRLVRNAE